MEGGREEGRERKMDGGKREEGREREGGREGGFVYRYMQNERF